MGCGVRWKERVVKMGEMGAVRDAWVEDLEEADKARGREARGDAMKAGDGEVVIA